MTLSGVNDLLVGAVNNYKINNSLRFSSARSTALLQNINSSGNRKTFTYATWIKISKCYGEAFSLYDNGKWDASVASQSNIRIQGGAWGEFPAGTLEIYDWSVSAGFLWRVAISQNLLLDTSSWMHILIAVDTTQTVASDRVKIWINGIFQTEFATAIYPSLNTDTYFNSGLSPTRYIGRTNNQINEFFDGTLADTYFIDGQALTPGAFGVFTDDGTFLPRQYTGSYGNTGFYLDYSSSDIIQNNATYSENFQSGALWSINPATFSRVANSGAAPNGANTATKLIQGTSDSGSVQHYLVRTIGTSILANNTPYTISFYVKPIETTTMQVFIGPGPVGGTNILANFDLVNLVANQAAGNANSSVNIQAVSDDWRRISIKFITSNVTNSQMQVKLLNSANNNNYVGDGVSGALIWGFQVNPGNTAAPYIYTDLGAAAPPFISVGVDKSTRKLNTFIPLNLQISANSFATDQTNDSPTDFSDGSIYGRGNYSQINVNDTNDANAIILGGTSVLSIGGSSTEGIGTLAIPTSGQWYWEVTVANTPGSNAGVNIGVADAGGSGANQPDLYNRPRLIYLNNGTRLHLGGTAGSNASGLSTFGNNDVIGVAVDTSNGIISFYKNNVLATNVSSSTLSSLVLKSIVEVYNGTQAFVNYGATPFTYTPPVNYKAINTFNLPQLSINRPKQYFKVNTWLGNNSSTRTIDNLEFAPNLVIIKQRSPANNYWNVFDSVRGVNKTLFTNQPADGASSIEISNNASGYLSLFSNNGYDLAFSSTGADVNQSGASYMSFNWRESVSSGLDIVSWTGNGTNPRNITHNLGVTPSFIIVKSRTADTHWRIWASAISANNNLLFNNADQFAVASTSDGGILTANSTTFTLGAGTINGNAVNQSGGTFIAYVFSEVGGFSKMGVYNGTGLLSGPFIYTGFKPALIMIKGAATGAANTSWIVFNSVSDKNAVEGKYESRLNSSSTESTFGTDIWTMANGFKLTNWDEVNKSGGWFFYAAWADVPLKYARGR